MRFGAGLNVVVEDFAVENKDRFCAIRQLIRDLLAMSEGERRAEVTRIQNVYDKNRAVSPWETKREWEGLTPVELQTMNLVHNYFSFVDPRDANVGMERALVADYEGSHPVFIVDQHNVIGEESKVLADLFYPNVPVRGHLEDSASLIDWRLAKDLMGFEAQYSMKPYFDQLAI
ncbi:MAG: hypothetical protein ACO36I_11980 [Candidatus Latescibacterota bacterium]